MGGSGKRSLRSLPMVLRGCESHRQAGACRCHPVITFLSYAHDLNPYNAGMEQEQNSAASPAVKELVIQVVHDNHPHAASLRTAWGFAALVTGTEKTILFDTGSDGALLLENMARLHIEPGSIDVVVLSHVHGDHTGGLTGFLERNPHVHVYLPEAFPTRFKDAVRGYGATVVEVNEPREVCAGVYTTGVLGRRVKEQALIVRTRHGLVILTGCAHPGIAPIIEKAGHLHDGDIFLVIGGFHLEWFTQWRLEKIIGVFHDHGVQYVAPTHCSSDKARLLFQRHYGERYLDVGVGKTVALADLR
jgi:7,8-dihydropterin-6-yl-methyl-4-(beta-D-ribofuranosyl)aminobenzene 5'-phosphate synthase